MDNAIVVLIGAHQPNASAGVGGGLVYEVALFYVGLGQTEIRSIMLDGLADFLAVNASSQLATTCDKIKANN